MRYHEIASGLRLPVSSEEQAMLDRAEGGIARADLDERGQEVARMMVSRGLLDRRRDAQKNVVYRVSSVKDIWRGHDR